MANDTMEMFNDKCKGLFIHEIQHAIQDIEGFEVGGDAQGALKLERMYAADYLLENDSVYREIYAKRGQTSPEKLIDYIDNYLKKQYNLDSIEDVAYKAYDRLMGEREAESSRERMGLNSDEREQSMPNYDEGVLLWNENVDKSKAVLHRTRENSNETSEIQAVSSEGPRGVQEKESSDLQRDLEEEISIIDEALKDKSLPSSDRVALIKDKVRLKRQSNNGRDVVGKEDSAE